LEERSRTERSLCDLLKRLIAEGKADMKRKEETIGRLEKRIQKLSSQPHPDTTLIQELNGRVETLKQVLVTDQAQQQAMEEEFSAGCHG
jgi:hypothetical protein